MKYCRQCHVNSLDSFSRCPLCEALLEETEDVADGMSGEQRYPDLEFSKSSYTLVKKIYIFLSILIIGASTAVDLWMEKEITWSIVSIAAVLYSWTVVYHAIKNNVHIASKIFVQAISGSVFIFLVDKMTGFDGWSVNYVIPQIYILANVTIFVLMMINRMAWREYVFYELSMTLIGLIPIIMIWNGTVTRPLLSYICIVISAVILIGTVVFGDKTVKSELIRRFHI